jgi:DNA segregation ATPase FtsK/SpoIIIE, S-DNA-T family
VATQRPSVDVVTGLIKANLPARIAFAVASQTDSRVILDSPGAEALLGSGDGLYMAPDSIRLARMQGAWVSDEELSRIICWWQDQAEALHWSPADVPDSARWDASDRMVQPRLWVDPEQDPEFSGDETDELLDEAIELVREEQRASISMLQRHFRIGYTRAARIVDMMDERGVIGPPTGSSRPRDVLLRRSEEGSLNDAVSKGAS